MNKRMALIANKIKAASEKMNAILETAGETALSEDQQKEFDGLKAEVETLNAQMAREKQLAEIQAAIPAVIPDVAAFNRSQVEPDKPEEKKIVIPAKAKRWAGKLQAFKGPDADLRAYKAGQWYRAINGNQTAAKWCLDHGVINYDALHQENVDSQGGYLVPEELDTDIISIVEEYGVARRALRRTPMTSDTKRRPRRSGGLTGYFVGEGAAATESTKSWNQVLLVAKKYAVLTRITAELDSDAIISVADDLTQEIALAFATGEDNCAFLGDGTSTYGGIQGLTNKFTSNLTATTTDVGGNIVGTGNLMSELAIAEHHRAMAKLANIPGLQRQWWCSPYYWAAVMCRLELAAGGNTIREWEGGFRPLFLGYPVNFVTSMPASDANSQTVCYFGDLKMAGMFGDRAGMAIRFSRDASVGSQSVFERDEIAVIGTERFDIVIHDIGTSSVRGPVTAIQSLNA